MSGLPKSWLSATIEQVLTPQEDGRIIHQGWSPQCESHSSESDKDWGVLKTTSIQPGRFHPEYNKKLPRHLEPRPNIEVKVGDLLLTCAGPRARCGVSCLVKGTRPKLMLSGKMYRIRVDQKNFLPEFLEAYLQTETASVDIDRLKTGGSDSGLNLTQDRFRKLSIPIAPLAEQRRIVAKLDSLTARTARARSELDHIPRLVEKYKQAILAKAFSGEMTKEWRASHKKTHDYSTVLRERISKQREARRNMEGVSGKGSNRSIPVQVSELSKIPTSWAWLTFGDCAWDLTVGHVGPMKERYVSNGVPFLRSFNVKPNRIETEGLAFIDERFNDELGKSKLAAGTVVVVRTGAPGTAAVIPETLNGANCSDLVICRLVDEVHPHFAAHYINSSFAQRMVTGFQVGVAQQHFNVGAMSQLAVPLTSLEEQREIVRRIETAFTWLDKVAAEHARASHLVPKLDQSILAKAFRGELVPQDPNDEPASKLLERIQTQRNEEQPERKRRRTARGVRNRRHRVRH